MSKQPSKKIPTPVEDEVFVLPDIDEAPATESTPAGKSYDPNFLRRFQEELDRSREELDATGITAAELTRAVFNLAAADGAGKAKQLLEGLPPADFAELSRSEDARTFEGLAQKYLTGVSWSRLILSRWVNGQKLPSVPVVDQLAGYKFPMSFDEGLSKIGMKTKERTKDGRKGVLRAALVAYEKSAGYPDPETLADNYMEARATHGFQTLQECLYARRVLEAAGAVSKSAKPS